jgi:hypothetical protein
MDKYKDFQDLKDTDEMTLKELFCERTYSKYINDPLADDIIIIDDIRDAFTKIAGKPNTAKKTYTKVSSYQERMKLKKKQAVGAFQFPETTDIDSAKFELSFLKPSEIEHRYLRKRVEAYLKLCRRIIKEEENNPKKGKVSDIRARAFCIALIQESGKMNFLKEKALRKNDIMQFAKDTWGKNGRTVYNECLNIISENNPINKWYKEENPEEFELGFKIFKEMFPD